ncbi:MAG: O-antigen ligase family protein [Candidatus Liptonbacteria bacterium]|nr:O-antigen ligase family protein [Candidatus Liptonbacteria bacterium]
MTSRLLVRIIVSLVFFVLIGTPLFYLKTAVYPYILSKTIFFQALVEILFFLWLVLIAFEKRFRPRPTPLLKTLLVFLGALFLSALFGEDFHRSFWSTYERMFGVFAIFHFAALAVVISSLIAEIPWRKLFYVSLVVCFAVSVLAAIQIRTSGLLLPGEPGGRPGATFGNPTFFAGYLVFHIFIALYFLLDAYKRNNFFLPIGASRVSQKGKVAALLPIFFFGGSLAFSLFVLALTETRGDILGLGVGVFVLLILFVLKPPALSVRPGFLGGGSRVEALAPGSISKSRRIYLGFIAFIVVMGAVFWFTRGSAVWSRVPGASRFSDISFSSSGLQPRLVAIKSSWLGFLDRPLFGWGWENFNVVYNKYYDPRTLELNYEETRFDKPHNFFMEDLATGGIILTLAHLALLALLVTTALKLKDVVLGQIITAALAAYFVRSIFIFDTVGPALMLYTFLGLVDGWSREESVEEKKFGNGQGKKIPLFALLPATLIALFVLYQINMPTVRASRLEYDAFTDLSRGRPLQGIENFKKILALPTPYRWNFARDFSSAISTAYFYNNDAIPQEAALEAIREMERVVREHPSDAYNHYTLVDMYNQVADLDPNFLNLAEQEAAEALRLSPDRQEVYFSLAKTKTLRRDYGAALEVLEKALALDDKVPDAHFYYGVVAYAAGDYATGYRELKIAIQMKRQWKNFYEPRTVANFFADSGHLDEAIELYKQALDLGPDEAETKIKLGIAYFYANRYDVAAQYLREAGKQFDFKKSASYPTLRPILEKLGIAF